MIVLPWYRPIAAFLIAVYCAGAHADCFNDAAARYGVEPNLLRAIAMQESSGRWNTTVENSNGTVDRGLMGINSIHMPSLARFGISVRSLYDPCTNIYVGAWLLKKEILKYGYTWAAVGAYHSNAPALSADYQWKIYRRWRGIAGHPQSGGPAGQQVAASGN
ncbi:MAG: BapC protein [Burkholderiaceae bacterium]|nr:MAG: BapC protein [Burkholderiaceae bacterium]